MYNKHKYKIKFLFYDKKLITLLQNVMLNHHLLILH